MGRSWLSYVVLVLGLILSLGDMTVVNAGRGGKKPRPTVNANTPDGAMKLNLENAIKLFLAAKGTLAPNDVSEEPSEMPMKHGKHGAMLRQGSVPCILPDGCVIMNAKIRFLQNKFIPGNDNVLSEYFKGPGHVFSDRESAEAINQDFKMYLLSRPKFAVPDVVRKLLMPEGDGAWPGGGEGDRSSYYPKNNPEGTKFWETDVAPIAGAEGGGGPSNSTAAEGDGGDDKKEEEGGDEEGDEEDKKSKKKKKGKKDEDEEEEEEEEEGLEDSLEMSTDDILDFMIWTLVLMSFVLVPCIIMFCAKSYFKRDDNKKTITSIRNNLKALM